MRRRHPGSLILLIFLITLTLSCGDVPHDIEGITYEGITFVAIPGGTFLMGDVEGGGYDWEKPVHTVTVSGLEMSVYEVTNARYASYLTEALSSGDIEVRADGDVYGKTGAWSGQRYLDIGYSWNTTDNKCWITYGDGVFSVTVSPFENWPVIAVTWYGAKAFALYYGLDLPTEAEWEYACRGGRQLMYGTDDGTITSRKANYIAKVGHATDGGSYPANPFGLHDMSGNVWEWCHDWYGPYTDDSVTDPTGAQSGSDRVIRGGGWLYSDRLCRAAVRGYYNPGWSGYVMGFRVVRRTSPQNY